jgi:hypothetical protein
VIAVDLPGFGESSPCDGVYGIESAVGALVKFFAHLGSTVHTSPEIRSAVCFRWRSARRARA